MTVDFGFYCMSLSGTLWNDVGRGANTNNGIYDTGDPAETPIPFIRIRLFDGAGNEILVGNDGILGTADDLNTVYLTDSNGNYSFGCLPTGQYVVGVDSGGTSSDPTSTTPDDNIDNDDNGAPGTIGGFTGIISNPITLTPGKSGSVK